MSHVAWVTDASLDLLKERLKPEDAAFFSTVAEAIGDKKALPRLESFRSSSAFSGSRARPSASSV
jgi:hypothetical protein